MRLTFRAANRADFDALYLAVLRDLALAGAGRIAPDFRAAAEREWNVLMGCSTTLTMLALDEDRPPGAQIVGVGQAAFVSDAFVAWARGGEMAPWINARVTQTMPDGSWPLLDPGQVRAANSGTGLNVLLARWATSLLPPNEVHVIRAAMGRESLRFYRGYNFKEMLVETTGDEARRRAESSGFFPRCDHGAFYRRNPPLPPPERHPCILGVTREEALAGEGSLISHIFAYAPPRLFFKPHEQEMLLLALNHASDERLAAALCLTVGAVKRRWLAIYRRVEEAATGLLPGGEMAGAAAAATRGPEKRRILLRYLADHPEELRPLAARPLSPMSEPKSARGFPRN